MRKRNHGAKRSRPATVEASAGPYGMAPSQRELSGTLHGLDLGRPFESGAELLASARQAFHPEDDAMRGSSDSEGPSGRNPGRRKHRRSRRKARRRGSRTQDRDSDDWFGWADWAQWHPGGDAEVEGSLDEAQQLEAIEPSLLSEKGRALLEARRRADRKVKLYRSVVRAGVITLCCFLVPPVGIAALIYFGIKLGPRAYRELIEPEMRERLVRAEVDKQLHVSVSEERRALQDEHSRSLEQLSARVAHEIRNPITAAKSLVQQMGEEPDSNDNVEYARIALAELERVEKSVSHLLRYARDEDMRVADLKMIEIVESALETFRERSERTGIQIEKHFDSDGAVRGDPEKLRRVVINLLGNAIDALDDANVDDPRVEISLGENLAGTEVWLRVSDNGVGIDASARASLFDPFVTSKSTGTGLGLPITKKLIESHEGTIEVESEPGQGAEFIVTLPKNNPRAGA